MNETAIIMKERDHMGSWLIMARAEDGHLLKQRYMLYTEEEAMEMFEQYYDDYHSCKDKERV